MPWRARGGLEMKTTVAGTAARFCIYDTFTPRLLCEITKREQPHDLSVSRLIVAYDFQI